MSSRDDDDDRRPDQDERQEPDSRDSDSQDIPSSSTSSGAGHAKRQKSIDGLAADPSSTSTTTSSEQNNQSSCEANPVSSSAGTRVPSSPTSGPSSYQSLMSSVAASPPRFVAMEEIVKAASGVANMYLAHEIAVDENFVLPDRSTRGAGADGSNASPSIKSRIEETMRKAYWDLLQSQLDDSPPVFKQAVSLVAEVKEILLSLLLPQHTRLKQEIDEILDMDLILQQAEHGTLDLPRYGQYVLSVMARLCAPVRDQEIRTLTQTTDVCTLFRGIMELLDLMKLDWANFSISAIRPHLQQQSIEYERKKFAEFLVSQAKVPSPGPPADPLMYTRTWLRRNYLSLDLSDADDGDSEETNDRLVVDRVLTTAYSELLQWKDSLQDLPPESLLMDMSRFLSFRDKVRLFTLTGSVILVTFSTIGPSVQQLAEFKQTLKQHLFLILGDSASDPVTNLESAGIQVCKDVAETLAKHAFPPMDDSKRTLLLSQITGLSDEGNRVRVLLQRRITEFIEGIIMSQNASPVQIPSGLSVFSEELLSLTGQFVRLVTHNRAVFGEYYADIIKDLRSTGSTQQATKS